MSYEKGHFCYYCLFFIISCVGTRKVNNSKNKLNSLDSQLVSYNKDLENLDKLRKRKKKPKISLMIRPAFA